MHPFKTFQAPPKYGINFLAFSSTTYETALKRKGKTTPMRQSLRQKIIEICDLKIEKKGETVGLSFYAFFANKNDNPDLLMEAATWWIETHKLDHFEKAKKIKDMVLNGK